MVQEDIGFEKEAAMYNQYTYLGDRLYRLDLVRAAKREALARLARQPHPPRRSLAARFAHIIGIFLAL